VQTQKRYERLEQYQHEMESIVDIEINQGFAGSSKRMIVESKVDSNEHTRQLQRYAQHLSVSSIEKGYLLFLTKHSAQPSTQEIFRHVDTARIHFVHRRWYDVYRILKRHAKNTTLPVQDLLTFLEEYDMTMPTTFSPETLAALNRLPETTSLMDKILNEIKGPLTERIGAPRKSSTRSTRLVRHSQYIDTVSFGYQFSFGIGFFLRPGEWEYPRVGMFVETGPQCPVRDQVLAFINSLGQKTASESDPEARWFVWGGDWAGASRTSSLQGFLAHPDSVAQVTTYLTAAIELFHHEMQAEKGIRWVASREGDGEE
jgi:hypothetical protein